MRSWTRASRYAVNSIIQLDSDSELDWVSDTDGNVHVSPMCCGVQSVEDSNARSIKAREDRALAIMYRRAASWAHKLGVTTEYMWIDMNWQALVAILRSMMTPEGKCVSCGHKFDNERDIQIEHREPPRKDPPRGGVDWARHHARNIGILCQPCNSTKQN